MSKNIPLKLLTGGALLVVILVIFNSHSNHTSVIEVERNPIHEEVAAQFNDNLREVAARLQETEKKLNQVREENQKLSKTLADRPDEHSVQPISDNHLVLEQALKALKDKVEALQAEQHASSYSVTSEEASIETKTTSIENILP